MKKLFLALCFLANGAFADGPAVHGMVVFGDKTLYASHVPMFHKPHDFQAILEIQLSKPGADAEALYRKIAFQENKQVLLTVMPKPFVLPDLLSGKINSFTADLFLGNFEDGGERVLEKLTVTVKKIVYQSRLSLATSPVDMSYLVLKDGYLVHFIKAPQSFDEILQLETALPEGTKSLPGTEDALGFRLGEAGLGVKSAFYCTVGPDFASPCSAVPH